MLLIQVPRGRFVRRWLAPAHHLAGIHYSVMVQRSRRRAGILPPNLASQERSWCGNWERQPASQNRVKGNSLSSCDKGCQVDLCKRNPTFQAAQVSHRNWSISTLAGEWEENLDWPALAAFWWPLYSIYASVYSNAHWHKMSHPLLIAYCTETNLYRDKDGN